MGETLFAYAKTYPTLMSSLVEGMQNGIDNGATAVLVGIDLGQRQVIVADNGSGTTRERFEEALMSIGKSIKAKDKLGRFGRGLISPLDKCTSFTFASRPSGRGKTRRWTFRGEQIKKQHRDLTIPCDEIDKMPVLGKRYEPYLDGKFSSDWRTMVHLNGVTQDRVVSLVDLDELEAQVRTKLGLRMHKQGVAIRVVLIDADKHVQVRDINPVLYRGEALDIVTYHDPDVGEVTFQLYRAPKLGGRRSGEVSVMEADSDYPISMKEFSQQARGRGWSDDLDAAFKALGSGHFEGVITCKNIVLHPERNKFEYNDALQMLYLIIGQWFDEVGVGHFEDEQEATREARYQELGLASCERIRERLHDPAFASLWDSLRSVVEHGRLGSGHADPSRGEPDGFEDDSSLRTGQGGVGTPKTPREPGESGGSRSSGGERGPDRPGDTPIGVTGPRGRKRQLVKGDSLGLWFEYSILPDSVRLWEFDFERGVLSFNVRHPIWVKLDETNGKHIAKNRRWIMHLQEWLALEVLHLLLQAQDPEDFEIVRDNLDRRIVHYVDMFIVGSPSTKK